MNKYLSILLAILFIIPSCKKEKENCNFEEQKINELQFIGSHNSYRTKTHQPIFDFVTALGTDVLGDLDPTEWDYTHVPFSEQLDDYNVRSFEIDVYYDPEGGRFYNRRGNVFIGEAEESNIPALLEPGYKVIHLPDLDYNTHYYTFKEALGALKDWSEQNPSHEPLFIMLELKDEAAGDFVPALGFATALPYTSEAMEDLEAEVKDVFGENLDGVYTPDKLRGTYTTVEEAVLNDNWPTLAEARGQIFFVLSANEEAEGNYLLNHDGLEGRAMFMFSGQGNAETAFLIMDNPQGSGDAIKEAVRNGYFVRTRADASTTEGRTGETARRDAAFASGAQMISTDYYRADPRHKDSDEWSDYSVQFSNGSAFQLNTVNNDGPDCPK